jgi:hypothetical protein
MSTADLIDTERAKRLADATADLTPLLTKEEAAALVAAGMVPLMSALKAAEETVALGLARDLGSAFTPQDDEHPLGTVVETPEDGVGVVIEYAEQGVYETDAQGRVIESGSARRVMVHLDDGALKVYPNYDLTPV